MRKPKQEKILNVHRRLLTWYRKQKRQFFWRNTSDPYEILVSEIMLQQTQASRVQEKLPLFLKNYPDFRSLANATKADVIRAWRGMGYNNRALRLKELATIVAQDYEGKLPDDLERLRELPGIGKYTSHAVMCFGFRKRVPVIDVNIERVLSRVFWKMVTHAEMRNEKELWSLAEDILPKDAYTWNQALMELGSTLCKARSTNCGACPISEFCSSKHLEKVQARKSPAQKSSIKKEKTYDGVPLRIWRGKIVEALRNVNGEGSISLLKLGKRIKEDFRHNEIPWLEFLVQQLEHDGIAATRRRGVTTKVMLAE